MKKTLIVLALIIIIVFGSVLAYNYFKPNIINLETLDESVIQGKDYNNPADLKSIIEKVEDKNILPANPRIKVFYQGVEVAYIDHLGNIYGSSGWFTNLNATTTNSTVFYEGGFRLALNSSLTSYLPITDQRYNETQTILDNNASWSRTDNSSYRLLTNNTFTANINITNKNITDIVCLIFQSGGQWCSA